MSGTPNPQNLQPCECDPRDGPCHYHQEHPNAQTRAALEREAAENALRAEKQTKH